MGCCFGIAKYLLFAFNFLFWLAGAAILAVGIWLSVDETASISNSVVGLDSFYAGTIVLIVAGCVMLIVGFFGCCGAIKESTCLLGLYFGFLFIVFALEVGIGIWAFVSYDSLDAAITTSLNNTDLTLDEQDNLYNLQQRFQCCGTVNGCEDWNSINSTLGSHGCGCDQDSSKNTNCTKVPNNCNADQSSGTNFVYGTPCNESLTKFIQDNYIIIGAVGLAIGLAEILGMIVSMCLCCSIKDKNKVQHA